MRVTPPITPSVFLTSLVEIGLLNSRSKTRAHGQPWRIGLCISGGPDSMALAYLLQNIPHPLNHNVKAFLPYAFVVDHDARAGSHEEAAWVKAQLETLGIVTRVTKLVWPDGIYPGVMKGFEEEARKRRYHALASMAVADGIDHLFTGHHQDDQVETVLLRLLRDRAINPISFQGMSTTSTLPHCEDIFLASQSSAACQVAGDAVRYASFGQLNFEQFSTGIQLHRPLLSFHKDQLLATCEHYGVPYVHDKTNFDPKLTPRNAVRHLRTWHTLPKALQHTAVLDTLDRARAIQQSIEEEARRICSKILEFRMHSASGVLYLRLRELPSDLNERQLRGFSFFMSRVVALLSPLPSSGSPTLLDRNSTKELHSMIKDSSATRSKVEKSLVFQKVICRPLLHTSPPGTLSLCLSRQPMSQSERNLLKRSFESTDTHCPHSQQPNQVWSRPILWDNRFWVEVSMKSEVAKEDIVLRAYEEADASTVRQVLRDRGLLQSFESVVRAIAPERARYTLPVLVVRDKIAAFPTLNFNIASGSSLHWRVWYSRDLRSMRFLFPGIRSGDIKSWNFTHDMNRAGV